MEFIEITKKSQTEPSSHTLVIGCFYIFHKGKQHVLETANQLIKGTQEKLVVIDLSLFLTAQLVTPEKTMHQLLKQYDVNTYGQLFPEEGKTMENTIADVLAELTISHIVIDQELIDNGTISNDLLQKFKQMTTQVKIVSGVKINEQTVTDEMIYDLITNGRVEQVQGLLNHPYTVVGKVVHGEKLGRQLGFPTLNLAGVEQYVMPKPGVYFGTVGIHKDHVITDYYNVLISAGYRPTVNGQGYLIEAHILNYAGDLYDRTVSVSFLHFMREEQDFSDLDALIKQMEQDKKDAERFISISD
ncbi:riboflavin kinase [Paraliobacillus salinarum]|uniref:riboflavin kinase n=1 Tax=Paraliobacillus salinarum TaxID=1158996 RepID=UPI0015F5FBC1|nr:riboflavin kinase [Paraliobacillus salinarum]